MKKSIKTVSLILCILFIFSAFLPAVNGIDVRGEKGEYSITNPYKNVDWNAVRGCKTALHNHTNASDGDPTLKESIERHIETGFDIVAVTDHGTVNYSWADVNENKFIYNVMKLVGRTEGDLEYLGTSGTFADGRSYVLTTENGDDYLYADNSQRVMRVPYGIEQNAVSVNAHVNSWFVDFHDNSISTYVDAISGVQKAGGVCVINHPGEYTKARYELHSSDAYNPSNFNYWYHINKFASLLNKYDRCIGIDINSKGDDRTRFDRILWDKLLMRFAPNGKNVFAICSSDAHQLDKIDTGFVIALLPEQTSKALSSALLNGEFFGGSHCIGNYEELVQIASALKKFYGETDLYKEVSAKASEMAQRVRMIEEGELDPDSSVGVTYRILDDDGFCTAATQPEITSISVDENSGTITVNSENALIVRWISDGELITTTSSDNATFTIADYSDKTGSYVRAEVFGEGGILYTQPFIISDGSDVAVPIVDGGFFDLGVFDFLIGVFNNWFEILGRFFNNLF
ncbi:MAG: PHP domain-containing protein [Clostridia bacterium]|nr:PHP domain-containing protein [Clostridia bacterium]